MGAVVTRRGFVQGLGLAAGSLVLSVRSGSAAAPAVPSSAATLTANAFVAVAPDGVVTIVCHRSEMGQGIRSTLPALIARELGADMARVRVVQADGDPRYGDQDTDGSTSIRAFYEELRLVGATARTLLTTAAAKAWGVAPDACDARDHCVTHRPSRRTKSFGELVPLALALPLPKPTAVRLRPAAEVAAPGEPMPVLDAPAMVTGTALYGADIVLPGMLVAVVAQPPVLGSRPRSVDDRRARAVPGVRAVLPLPAPQGAPAFQPLGGVAVVGDHTWAALRGRRALSIEWEPSPHNAYNSEVYRGELLRAVRAPGTVVRQKGDVEAALHRAARRLEAEYYVPHLAQAPMEPPAAIADAKGDTCEVWAATQNPQEARTQVAKALGLPEAKVTVHVTLLGGGFGRKSKPDYVVEAALLSKAVGKPVRVQWTREDDLRHGYVHTVSAQRLVAGLGADGKLVALLHRTAFPPIRSTFDASVRRASTGELGQGVLDWPFDVPHLRAEVGEAEGHVRIGWMRSVNNIQHAFAIGSFVDEIAHARGQDSREALLEIIGPPRLVSAAEAGVAALPNYGAPRAQHPIDTARLRRVVERVTERAGWASRGARALGLAAHRSFLTYVAVVLEVERSPRGVRVKEAWIAADAGLVVNPDRVRAQLEGALVFGMSLALHGELTATHGAIVQTNFRDYPVVRLPEVPHRIHIDLVPSDAPPGGVGEPGVPPVAPALANAVAALTGQRLRELPLRLGRRAV